MSHYSSNVFSQPIRNPMYSANITGRMKQPMRPDRSAQNILPDSLPPQRLRCDFFVSDNPSNNPSECVPLCFCSADLNQTPFVQFFFERCTENFSSKCSTVSGKQSSATATLIEGISGWVVHAGAEPEGICIQHGVVRINHVRNRCISTRLAFSSLLLLLLFVLRSQLLLSGRRHVRLLPVLLESEALAVRRVRLIVVLRRVVPLEVVCVEIFGSAGMVVIGIRLIKHGVRGIRCVVLLFCTHELTLGRQSSTVDGEGGGGNLPSWSICF